MSTITYDIKRAVRDLVHPVFIKQMAWSLLFAIFTALVLLASIAYLKSNYPTPPRPNDLILDRIPEMSSLVQLGDTIGRIGTALMLYILWEDRFRSLPRLLFLLSVMYLLRAVAIILTPLAQIQPPEETFTDPNIFVRSYYHGMYFSGHTASAFVQVFFIKRGHPLRPVAALLGCLVVLCLLGSHSHYSIDIFGGFFVAYSVTHFDFMRLVPKQLLNVTWMPWYEGEPVRRLQVQH